MFTSSLFVAFATFISSVVVVAQTPDGFSPGSTVKLGVSFPQSSITVTPGLAVPRQDTATAPTITPPTSATANTTYTLFMLDLDVSRNNTRVTLLHWFQSDLTLSSSGSNKTLSVSSNNKTGPGAAYLQPSPPVGDIAHRYTQILFAQPSNFSVPTSFGINPPASTTNRIGFDLASFVKASGLGSPVAGNFFTVQQTNTTGTGTGTGSGTGTETGTASGSGSATGTTTSTATATGSTVPFKGGVVGVRGLLGEGWRGTVAVLGGVVVAFVGGIVLV